MAKLTHQQLLRLAKPGRYGDGGGLYLSIAPGGTKSFVQRVTVDGKRRDIGLGGFPAVSLAQARKKARENKAAVKDGRNPTKRPSAREIGFAEDGEIPTFKQAAARTYQAKIDAKVLTNDKHRCNWFRRLELHAFPTFGARRVDKITRKQMVDFVERMHKTGKIDTAQRVRAAVREVLDDCVEREEVNVNHAGEAIKRTMQRLGKAKQTKHQRALYHDQVRAALDTLWQIRGMREATLALHFLVLTGARSGEIRGATWDEIDMDAWVWTIPGERMKGGITHRVPLTTQMAAVIGQAAGLARQRGRVIAPGELIFPRKRGEMLSDQVFTQRLNKLSVDSTAHGFRSSFKGWAAEQGWANELSEKALAHKTGNQVEQAYNRVDLLEQRRPMLQAWNDYIDPPPF